MRGSRRCNLLVDVVSALSHDVLFLHGASTHIHLYKLSQRSLRFHAFSFLALFRNQGPLQIIKYGLYTLLRLFIQSVPLVLHNRLFDTALSRL